MSNENDAFWAGLYDGVAQHSETEKVAEAFMQGVRDGVAIHDYTPILDKIAAAVEEVEEVDETSSEDEEQADAPESATEMLINSIRQVSSKT
jgi:hypothetical protein